MANGGIHGMKMRIHKLQPDGVLPHPVVQQPPMIRMDGLWIHQGAAEPGANWLRVMNLVREERIQTVLKS
jgi:hypothetical protein